MSWIAAVLFALSGLALVTGRDYDSITLFLVGIGALFFCAIIPPRDRG